MIHTQAGMRAGRTASVAGALAVLFVIVFAGVASAATPGTVSFALATAGQAAPANADWSVDWRHYTDSTCSTQDGSGTATYSGNTLSSGAQPAVDNNQWAKPVAASASGYALAYWSASSTSTTPLTATQLCTAGPGNTTLYAHLRFSDGPPNQTAVEGTSTAFDLGSFTDTGPSTWSVDVDWGDGSHTIFTTTTPGPLGTQNHVYADNGTYGASVTVHRGVFTAPPNPFAVTVANANPTATLSNSGPVAPGSPVTIAFSRPFDPSSADTTAGFRYAFHCDGSPFATAPTYGGSSTSPSIGCWFGANGTYLVRARILDKDDGFSEYTTAVTVSNAVGFPIPPPPARGPKLMHPFPVVRTEGHFGRRRTTFTKIIVKAPKGARIVARCSHHRCRRTARTLHRRRTVHLKRMQRSYPPKTTLTIRIGSRTLMGKYVSIRTRRGKPPVRHDSCLPAGRRAPKACPQG